MEGEAKEGELARGKEALPVVASSSPCSSPSHEFTFTISFHHPSPLSRCHVYDLAPADDIFFHGHLLPLQILPRPPPTLVPVAAPEQSQRSGISAASAVSSSGCCSTVGSGGEKTRERMKKKLASSLFAGVGRWWKAAGDGEDDEEKRRKKRAAAFDAMSRMVKKYVKVLEPLLFFRGTEKRRQLQRRPCSFTVNPNSRAVAGREEQRRRRGELSAPASMRTSPTNSGLLVPQSSSGGSSEESTMEELQSAIEAAIAHCKSSVATNKEPYRP